MNMSKKLIKPSITPYYDSKSFTLFHGDAVEVMYELPENSIDMIFADPPYFLSDGSFTCQNGKMASVKKGDWDIRSDINEKFQFHQEWLAACKRVLKDTGTIWISGTYHSIYACGFALQLAGFHILNDISWFKPNAAPNLSCRFFTASHETLLWARKNKKSKHTFNYEGMKYGDWSEDLLKKKDTQMRSVWSIPTPSPAEKKEGIHPTQKPLKLLNRIMLATTNEGALVLDPFCGSGTTGIAAIENNRKFIGIDLELSYLEIALRRNKSTTKKLKLI